MSRTTIYLVPKSGPVRVFREFSNAFRGAWLVWDSMAKRYLGLDAVEYMIADNLQPVWDLWKDRAVPEAHRIVMASTFDAVMVKRENLERLAAAFDQYAMDFADPGHIPAEAAAVRELAGMDECFAVCWQQTSVSADVWRVWMPEVEDSRPYDVSIDNEHWFLFDALEALEAAE
ncbi:MAG: hypothetical protein EHM35_00165 [Planctomycetaceae bacterium]|nr:MAG: hypothetical protein EHM35_00165 [Planctomycetaceae bacterium]